jgi:cytosine/adenosine deaminase-related metal-dependent hydrolase
MTAPPVEGRIVMTTGKLTGVKTARRTLIQGGIVVTMESQGVLRNADVLIEGGRILAIGRQLPAQDAHIIDAGKMIVLPGFVDAHRHCWQGAIRNIAVDTDLKGYFGDILASLAPRYRPEDVYAGTLSSDVEALDSGITALYDWAHIMNSPAHADEAIRAHRRSGMRVVFGYGFPNISPEWFYESAKPLACDEVIRVRDTYFAGQRGLLTLGLALRGPEHMSTFEVTRSDWTLARDLGLPISVHVGTGSDGVKYHAIQRLHDAGLLFEDTSYVHCVTLTDEDRKRIRDSGGYCISTPAVEMMMDFGIPGINKALAAGMRPGLGVDVVTTVGGDMFTQMRAAHQVARMQAFLEKEQGYGAVTSADILSFATIDGARAIGLGDSVGSLKEGKCADLLLLRTDRIALSPLNDPIGAIVAAATVADVDTVIVDGIIKKREGTLIDIDPKDVAQNAAFSGAYLSAKLMTN